MPPSDEQNEAVILIAQEQAEVFRRRLAESRVVVSTATTSREVHIDEVLTDEHIEIKHVNCGQFVDKMPAIREAGDTIIFPIVEEKLVLARRLFLVEEVHIRRIKTQRHHVETVVLREQEAVVQRSDASARTQAEENSSVDEI